MDEYIRADNDFRQRREEAYRYFEMARGFGGRFHPRHIRTIHNPNTNDYKANHTQSSQHISQSSGMQQTSYKPPAQRGRGGRSFGGRYGNHPKKLFCIFYGKDKGHTIRTCQFMIQKQKEIAEAEARQNQSKQVLHTASCYSPYIHEVCGQSATYIVHCFDESLPSPPGLSCHHHHWRLHWSIINIQKGITRLSNIVILGRSPKLARSTTLCPSQGISTEGGTTLRPKSVLIQYIFTFLPLYFLLKRQYKEV
jgi:hypothetical protein